MTIPFTQKRELFVAFLIINKTIGQIIRIFKPSYLRKVNHHFNSWFFLLNNQFSNMKNVHVSFDKIFELIVRILNRINLLSLFQINSRFSRWSYCQTIHRENKLNPSVSPENELACLSMVGWDRWMMRDLFWDDS